MPGVHAKEALLLDDQQTDARLELCQIKMLKNDIQSVQKLLEETNDSALRCRFYNTMGIARARQLKMHEAIHYYLMAHDSTVSAEEQSKILINIGIAYAKWGKPTEARYYAGLASALAPSSAMAARLNSILKVRKKKDSSAGISYEF